MGVLIEPAPESAPFPFPFFFAISISSNKCISQGRLEIRQSSIFIRKQSLNTENIPTLPIRYGREYRFYTNCLILLVHIRILIIL